jgi:hypothetical protein
VDLKPAGMDSVEKRKLSCLYRESKAGLLASSYTDCAVLTPSENNNSNNSILYYLYAEPTAKSQLQIQHSVETGNYNTDKHNGKIKINYRQAVVENNNSIQFIYLHADLTAQRPITKRALEEKTYTCKQKPIADR